MAVEESSARCEHCNTQSLCRRVGPNHTAWLLASSFTCGILLPLWFLASVQANPWRCSRCGSVVQADGESSLSPWVIAGTATALVAAILWFRAHTP